MRNFWLTLVLLVFGTGPGWTQGESSGTTGAEKAAAADETEAEAPQTFSIRSIDFGVQGVETDTSSSRFREYRAVPTGFVLDALHFAGNDRFRYDVLVENALQSSGARYRALAEPGDFSIDFDFQKIQHRFGNDGRTLHEERPASVFVISDTLQRTHQSALESQFAANRTGINFPFLEGLVNPSIAAASRIDLALTRDRGRIELGYSADGAPLDLRVSYNQERRYGNRASGTAFGFSNVVETAEPIEYRTHDFVTSAEWRRKWGLVRGGVRYNWFENAYLTQTFDNPFRITDSTDASAYQSPGSGSIGGAAVGRVSLPAENETLTGFAGFLVKLPSRTRVSADASLAQWKQDSPFMPFTTNTSIVTPDGFRATDPAALPARSLDGKIDVFSLSLAASSRPAPRLALNARFRIYDFDNKSPRVQFPHGYVRFDAVWEDIPRISVPYGYRTQRAQVSAAYDLGPVNVEGGYRHDLWDRTFREVEQTREGALFAAVQWRPWSWAILRASAERAERDFDGEYHADEAEHASFLEPGPATNMAGLRRYDLAKKETDRVSSLLQLTPWGNTTIGVSYSRAKDDYTESAFGLVSGDVESLSIDADYTPNERWSVYAFAGRDNFDSLQQARQSGATPSVREIDNWTSRVEDKVDTFGGGLNWAVVASKLDLRLFGSYQKVNGNNDLDSPPGGTPDVAFDITDFDDTRLLTLGAELGFRATGAVRIGFGGWLEDYELRDSATSTIATYLPGSIFLAANDGDYRAHVIYARASYVW